MVVDSGSTDRTAEVARRFSNVRWLVRPFDTHAAQWQFAIGSAETDYVLALDADYRVPADFVGELDRAFLPGGFAVGRRGLSVLHSWAASSRVRLSGEGRRRSARRRPHHAARPLAGD